MAALKANAKATVSRSQVPDGSKPSPYRWYVLLVLIVALVLNFADRQIPAILQESIKADLSLSDAQLGLLSGVAFTLLYVTIGLWIAKQADRGNRVKILSTCIAIWSLMTALCSLAGSFFWLFLARVGVGVGEAGGTPPSHSLLSDYFAPHERATALGILSLGMPIGTVVGFWVGGALDQHFGWRNAFLALGLPGLIVALLIRMTVREPERGGLDAKRASAQTSEAGLWQTARHLVAIPSYRHVLIASSLHTASGIGITMWLPSFLHRVFELSPLEAGRLLAVLIGMFASVGTLSGGRFCDHVGGANRKWYVLAPALVLFLACPFAISAYFASSALLTVALMALPIFAAYFHMGSIMSLAQTLVPPNMRTQSSAILMFCNGAVALGLMPLAIGVLSDLLQPRFAGQSLRYALALSSLVTFWAVGHYLWAARTLSRDLDLEL